MKRRPPRIPAPPVTPTPPSKLLEIASSLQEANVAAAGLTTTDKGEWALMIKVRSGVSIPLANVEALSEGFPVVYEDVSEELLVARPAFPKKAE